MSCQFDAVDPEKVGTHAKDTSGARDSAQKPIEGCCRIDSNTPNYSNPGSPQHSVFAIPVPWANSFNFFSAPRPREGDQYWFQTVACCRSSDNRFCCPEQTVASPKSLPSGVLLLSGLSKCLPWKKWVGGAENMSLMFPHIDWVIENQRFL